MSTKNKEIEFKYDATFIPLSLFREFCEHRNPVKTNLVSGWDHFMGNKNDPYSFYRHRVNANENQLTFKRKLEKDNNYIREEHNIDLPLSVSGEKIQDLCRVSGYTYNTSLFKNCFIYNYEDHTLVYYTVYDVEMKEIGRFVEIEMKEDYPFESEEEAFSSLVMYEKLYKSLGIKSTNRVSLSLYELYKKEL